MSSDLAEKKMLETEYLVEEVRIDKRAANGMDDRTRHIHLRLQRHAKWSKENHGGFPKTTLLGRFLEEGEGIHSRGKPPVTIPNDVAVTDLAIAKLGQIDRKVIQAYYGYWEPIEALSKKLGMRHREFANVLKRARWRVGLYIEQIELKVLNE